MIHHTVDCLQIKEVRDSRQVTIPALERLAAIVDGNDDMRTFFVESGGCARLSQLAASEHDSIKGGILIEFSNTQTLHQCMPQYRPSVERPLYCCAPPVPHYLPSSHHRTGRC